MQIYIWYANLKSLGHFDICGFFWTRVRVETRVLHCENACFFKYQIKQCPYKKRGKVYCVIPREGTKETSIYSWQLFEKKPLLSPQCPYLLSEVCSAAEKWMYQARLSSNGRGPLAIPPQLTGKVASMLFFFVGVWLMKANVPLGHIKRNRVKVHESSTV